MRVYPNIEKKCSHPHQPDSWWVLHGKLTALLKMPQPPSPKLWRNKFFSEGEANKREDLWLQSQVISGKPEEIKQCINGAETFCVNSLWRKL